MAKKIKTKKKAKKAKRSGKSKAKKPDESQGRELLVKVIERLGATVAIHKKNPDRLMVAHPYEKPFVIDGKVRRIIEIPPEELQPPHPPGHGPVNPEPVDPVDPEVSFEQQAGETH